MMVGSGTIGRIQVKEDRKKRIIF